jgi:sulfur carrier protein ThiS
MIKVTYRDQQWEVPGHKTVREVIQEVGLNPAVVLAVRHGKLALDSEMLGDDDELKLIAVISGGSSLRPSVSPSD